MSDHRIDLHIHSTASDGTFTPSEIIERALQLDLKAIAITDHDTIDGTKSVLSSGIPPAIDFLTGVEISSPPPPSIQCSGNLHILGYDFDPDHPGLNRMLKVVQQARLERNPKIIQCLSRLGFEISLAEVAESAGDKQIIGRPHIAMLMMKKGFVRSIQEAFERWIGTGKPAYVEKYAPDCQQVIGTIRSAGGISVLAHPGLLNIKDENEFRHLMQKLKAMSLRGLEAYYSKHSPKLIAYYADFAREHGLLITGGSDFHGALKKDIEMGSGKGDLFVPYELYLQLIAARHTI